MKSKQFLTFLWLAQLLALCPSCEKKPSNQDNGSDDKLRSENPAIQRIESLPYNTELSKIPGVSIIQVENSVWSGHSMTIDSDDLSTANATSAPLEDLVLKWTKHDGWMRLDAELPDRRYNVEVTAPEGTTNSTLLRHAFESIFGLSFLEVTESTDVWVLSAASVQPPLQLTPVEASNANFGTSSSPDGFGWECRAASMDDLAGILNRYVDSGIVLNETHINGYYKFTLSMDHWEPDSVHPAISKLGLSLKKTKRDLPMLVIDYADSEKTTE